MTGTHVDAGQSGQIILLGRALAQRQQGTCQGQRLNPGRHP